MGAFPTVVHFWEPQTRRGDCCRAVAVAVREAEAPRGGIEAGLEDRRWLWYAGP